MQDKLITVTKTASKKLPPDTVEVSVTAACSAKKHAEAARGASELAGKASAALKAAGFEVRLLGLNVYAQREDGKTVYRAAQQLSTSFDCNGEKLCGAMDALEKSGCEWRLSFSLKDNGAREELIARAVKDAKAEAGIIAQAAGVKLGGLKSAEYGSAGEARPMLMRAHADGAQIENITLSETVTCSWEID